MDLVLSFDTKNPVPERLDFLL